MPNLDRVVILAKENNTFNNYFGSFPGPRESQLVVCPTRRMTLAMTTRPAFERSVVAGYGSSYGETDIGAYWSYAKEYTLCDNYFQGEGIPTQARSTSWGPIRCKRLGTGRRRINYYITKG